MPTSYETHSPTRAQKDPPSAASLVEPQCWKMKNWT